ncbi:MAG TPA: TIGR02117 family protein [Flavobacterium sp.]|jgi:uncharacterized protein (TIGR02117 family)|nr:TIGR02117 family protein [Flavobacterium sp.]
MRKAAKIIFKIFIGFIAFLIIYVALAFTVSQITVNGTDEDPAKDVTVYIKSNGVHTDIVVPIRNDIKDWSSIANPLHTASKDEFSNYIAFGWGDKGFYLNTPEWSDLKASTAFNAAFYLGTSAVHATFHRTIRENERCVKINMSRSEYQKLVSFIDESFQKDALGNSLLIAAPTYGHSDSFYEANGKYNLFYTCNSWANNALKASGQKAALWSLTDSGIFCHYR